MQVNFNIFMWRLRLWVTFVFLGLGLGFGVNAWAVCEAERANADRLHFERYNRNSEGTFHAAEGRMLINRSLSEIDYQIGVYEKSLRESRDASDIASNVASLCYLRAARVKKLSEQNAGANPALTSNQPNQNNQNIQQSPNPLQSETQQAQQRARDNQTRADQDAQRKGKRSHEPAAEAHECVDVDASGSYGGLVNKCNYPIEVQYCNFRPKKDSWAAQLECGKSGGLTTVGAGKTSANHVKNTETVFFFACKKPALPSDVTYVEGKGLSGRCR